MLNQRTQAEAFISQLLCEDVSITDVAVGPWNLMIHASLPLSDMNSIHKFPVLHIFAWLDYVDYA